MRKADLVRGVSATATAACGSSPSSSLQKQLETQEGDGESKQQQQQEQRQQWEKLPKQDAAAASLLGPSPLPPDVDWINRRLVRECDIMGQDGYTETAQVHPFQFTTAIAALAQEAGADVRVDAKATKINCSDAGVQSVEYLERKVNEIRVLSDVTDVVVTAGPWTGVLLPSCSVMGLRAHSVVWEANVSPYAIFTKIDLPASYVPEHRQRRGEPRQHTDNVDPEIYARPGREVYACGRCDRLLAYPARIPQPAR